MPIEAFIDGEWHEVRPLTHILWDAISGFALLFLCYIGVAFLLFLASCAEFDRRMFG